MSHASSVGDAVRASKPIDPTIARRRPVSDRERASADQIADYATAVYQTARPNLNGYQTRKLVSITIRRQEILRDSGARLHLIIDEPALLRSIAPADVMTAQLDHLLELAARPSTTVQIATQARRVSVLSPAFTVLSFTDPADDIAVSNGPAARSS